jgi:hypothetical protein
MVAQVREALEGVSTPGLRLRVLLVTLHIHFLVPESPPAQQALSGVAMAAQVRQT